MSPSSLPYTCSNKKKISFCRLHDLYFALLMQLFGNNWTPKQFGVKRFQNSPLFLHNLFFLVFYCALFGTHLTRKSWTRHAKQKVWSVLACTTKATVTSIVLLIKYAHMPWHMSRSACRGMHACPCHHLFVGFPVDGHNCSLLHNVFDKQTMTSFPLQLKHFIDDTLINQINIKTTLSTSLHTSTVNHWWCPSLRGTAGDASSRSRRDRKSVV